jgi:NitT/TauT family transport system ATP-binding protein
MILGKLCRVEREYSNGIKALGPLDLEIGRGEFLSLLGPSGCGKSTALKIIAGLLAPSRGEVVWPGGKPQAGFVFQDATLMPWATVRENVRLPLDLSQVPRTEADARVEAAVLRVGLTGAVLNAYPRSLSGGMRMRVSVARALVARPALLLMDEPFAALDEISRDALNEDLLRVWREDEITVVFVTHSVFESTFLSTRIVALTPRPGRIAGIFNVPAPSQRSLTWRMSAGFSEAAGQVSAMLRQGMEAAA